MAEVPVWVCVGDLIRGGNLRAERPGFPYLTSYRQDALVAAKNPRFDWPTIHADAGVFAPAYIWNHHGLQAQITSITDRGDGTSRVVCAVGHGHTASTFPVTIVGVIRASGTDLEEVHNLVATRVSATEFDIPIVTAGGSYTYTSALVSASAGRTMQFFEAEDPLTPVAGRAAIQASSGDFVADGFRRGQELTVVDTVTGSAIFSGSFTVLSVTATLLAIRENVGGWQQSGGPYTSGITLQAKALVKLPSMDVTSNPLIGNGYPNSHTDEESSSGEVYPSEVHGVSTCFQAVATENFEGAALTAAKLFGTGNNFQSCFHLNLSGGGPFGSDHAKSFGIDSVEIAVGKTLLHLEKAHGLVGSRRVFVYGLPSAQTPSITGFHLATVEDSDTLSIPITSTAVPSPTAFRGEALGTVALPDLEIASAAINGDTLEITTTAAHGLSTGAQVWIGGVSGHQPDDINGRWRITVVDSDTFSIPLRTTLVSSTIAQGWISTKARHAKVFSCGSDPFGGGQLWDRNKLALESALEWIDEKSSDVPFVAGFFVMGGYNDDDDTGGNIAGLGGQVERFGRTLEELMHDLRDVAYAKEVALGATQHSAAGDIPVVVCAYNPTLTSDPLAPTRTVGGKLIANVLSLRNQAKIATAEIGGAVGFYDPNLDGFRTDSGNIFPTLDSIFRMAESFWRVWKNVWLAPEVPAAAENRAPVYVYFGQSQCVGTVQSVFLLLGGDPNYDGTHYDPATGKVRPGEERQAYIWHHGQGEFQEFTSNINGAAGNTNTHPIHNATQGLNFGPEVSGILKLRERHPEGVYFIKLGVGSSALAPVPGLPTWDPTTGTLYADLIAEVRKAYRWLITERGLVPDLRGFAFHQGESDSLEPYASEYQSRLTALISQIRTDVGTRSSAEPATPFVIGGLVVHERYPFNRDAGLKIVAAQQAVAAADPQAVYVDLDSVTIQSDDDTHYTGVGTIEAGLRLFGSAWFGLGTYLAPKVEELYLKDQEYGSPALTGQTEGGGGPEVPTGGAGTEATILQGTSRREIAIEIVALCDEAIAQGLEVLSWSANGKTVTKQSIDEIRRTRSAYLAELARIAGLGRTHAVFGGGR